MKPFKISREYGGLGFSVTITRHSVGGEPIITIDDGHRSTTGATVEYLEEIGTAIAGALADIRKGAR